MGHVAGTCCRASPWDMLRGLHGTPHGNCCEGSMGHVARAPWDMLRRLHGTCCEGSMGHGDISISIGDARSQMKTTLEPVNVKTTLNGTIYKGRLQSLDWTGLKNLMNDLSSSHRGAFPLLRSWLPDAVASSSSAQHRASRVSVSAKLIDPPRSKLPTHSFK